MSDIRVMTNEETIKLKKIQLEMLIDFDKVCKKHNLNYFLFGGTLLGAVRHGGYIPWDDDIDVVMPRDDLDKLEQIAQREFNDNYFFQNVNTDINYPLGIYKLRKNNTLFVEMAAGNNSHNGIYIDIFPLDKVDASDVAKIDKRSKKIKLLTTVISYKCGFDYNFKFKTKFLCSIISLLGLKHLKRVRHKLMTLDNNRDDIKTYTVYPSNYGWKKQLLEYDIYFPPSQISFEGVMFNAPNNTTDYLKNVYGDYMRLPPEEKRVPSHRIREIDFGGQ